MTQVHLDMRSKSAKQEQLVSCTRVKSQMSATLLERGHHQRWPQLWCGLQGQNLPPQFTILAHRQESFQSPQATRDKLQYMSEKSWIPDTAAQNHEIDFIWGFKERWIGCYMSDYVQSISLDCFTDYIHHARHPKNLGSKGLYRMNCLRLLNVGVALSLFLKWNLLYFFFFFYL